MMPNNLQQDDKRQLDSNLQNKISNANLPEELLNQKVALPPVPERCGPPTISLALLLDFAIQHTYHELTILSELLPKKKETDRKISVVQFAHSTRNIFVKLLAIVKWVRISKRFEPLTAIRYFLDQQAGLFVDTADRLVHITREELRSARLPNFHVPPAIDVLTLGAYPRLPQCIKNNFVSKPSLTRSEQALTLQSLNTLIERQLTHYSNTIAPKIDSIIIKNGTLILKVFGEFELCLTLLSEVEPLNWCLLNIKILVQGNEIGFGQKLIHPLQINFLHQIVQEKLRTGPTPLVSAYLVMHTFCQSLQLDVLYCQMRQISTISPFYVKVEEYDRIKTKLTISYWLKLISNYRITIFADPDDCFSSLKTAHYPATNYLPVLNFEKDCLSISKLINETIVERCRERLLRIKEMLSKIRPMIEVKQTGNSLLTLTYPLVAFGQSFNDESLEIATNNFLGTFVCHVRAIGKVEDLKILEKQLANNASIEMVSKTINNLRIKVMIERFNKAICGLQLNHQTIAEAQVLPILSKLKQLPTKRIILQFNREDQYFMVVTFTPDENIGVVLTFYLVSSINGKYYMTQLKADELAKQSSVPTIGLANEDELKMRNTKWNKAKMEWIGSHKQLQAAVASVDDRLVYLRIADVLNSRNIVYEGLKTEPLVGGYLLTIISLNSFLSLNPNFLKENKNAYCKDFYKNLYGCSLRLDLRQNLNWPFECTMVNCPLIADDIFNQKNVSLLTDKIYNNQNLKNMSSFEKTFSAKKKTSCTWVQQVSSQISNGQTSTVSEAVTYNIIERLSIYCQVYIPVKHFSFVYDSYLKQHCNIVAYTYHKLIISYGENRNYLLIMSWKPKLMMRRAQYVLNFGQCKNINLFYKKKSSWNPHILVSSVLNEKFNQNANLVGLVWYLINSYKSLEIIYNFTQPKLHSTKAFSQILSIDSFFPVELQCNLNVLCDSRLRLTYGTTHIEFFLLSDNYTGIRECVSTLTNSSNNFNNSLSPISGISTPQVNLSSFELFWKKISGGQLPLNTILNEDLAKATSPKNNLGLNCGISANKILKTEHSPLQRTTISIENSSTTQLTEDIPNPPMIEFQNQQNCQGLENDNNIVVSPLILEQAMGSLSANSPSALENYLCGCTILSRLNSVIEASRLTLGINHLPIRELQYILITLGGTSMPQLFLTIFCYQLPNLITKDPCLLRFRIFINSINNFKLSAKIEYNGSIVPSDSDICVFERYFEHHVIELFNEMAFFTFITLCRIASSPSIFSSFAQLMLLQLDPPIDARWHFNLQLIMWANGGDSSTNSNVVVPMNQRKVQCGIILNESCKQLLITVSFQLATKKYDFLNKCANSNLELHDRRQYTFIYTVLNNELSLRPAQAISNMSNVLNESEIRTILTTQSQLANAGGLGAAGNVCCIWPCIRSLYDLLNSGSSGKI